MDILDIKVYDGILKVLSEDVLEIVCEVVKKEGILVGIFFGVIVKVVLDFVKEFGVGKKVLVIVVSNGECYLSIFFYNFED